MSDRKRIVVGMSGASGAPLTIELLQVLRQTGCFETHLVLTEAARQSIPHETDRTAEEICALADVVHPLHAMDASIASGSFRCSGMIVAPCSMKTAAGIACGYSENLLLRAADVTIKERRPLVLLVRECPLSPIHLENLLKLARIGVWIVPMVMNYYSCPADLTQMNCQLVGKLLAPFELHVSGFRHWGEQE